MIVHSIRWRLQLWHGFLLTLLVTGLMIGFYEFERRSRLQAVDTELQEAFTPLLPRFAPPQGPGRPGRTPPDPNRPPPPRGNLPPYEPPRREDPHLGPPLEIDPIRSDRLYFVAWNLAGDRIAHQ